jgi:hypothetical protein
METYTADKSACNCVPVEFPYHDIWGRVLDNSWSKSGYAKETLKTDNIVFISLCGDSHMRNGNFWNGGLSSVTCLASDFRNINPVIQESRPAE